MKRTDINLHDVFISWTGKNRSLKDQIKDFLEANGIRCLESDYACSGDFRVWSSEAVHACSVFLLILTPDTLDSAYVPVEIASFRQLEAFQDRIVPVCSSMALYQEEPWGIHAYASAVILDDTAANEDCLNSILRKVKALLVNQMDRVYREVTKPDYIKLIPFLRTRNIPHRQYHFSDLYIYRSITERDSERQVINTYPSPEELCKSDDILFISGPAGSGKSRYIDQIRQMTDDTTVTICLPCHKLADSSQPLIELMYREFCRCCGNMCFYTLENFNGLLRNRHLLLVLDGVDEVATTEGTRKLLAKVEQYYAANSTHTTILLTGRNENDAQLIAMAGKQVRQFVLEPFSDSDILTFSRKLFRLFGAEDKYPAFYERVMALSSDIKTNPLLLSQLAIVYHDSGQIPQTVVGIYDAIVEITFQFDQTVVISHIPDNYRIMVTQEIPKILKRFSAEHYRLVSSGKDVDIVKVFSHILKDTYGEERHARAEYLVEYLQNRAILSDGAFYHKTFLEYFTATFYYENSFDDYDELEDPRGIRELFTHYSDPYWSAVIQLFLIKADICIGAQTAKELYALLADIGITDYTLLLETYGQLPRHRQQAQVSILRDMLTKSVNGTYPPYGPLFWYVPQYCLYEPLVLAADSLRGDDGFGKMLSLVRDVCYIYGQKYTVQDITRKVNPEVLYRAAELHGVRNALCQLFCTGHTDFEGGSDIYPRCFNVAEVRSFMEWDHGLVTRLEIPFEDELGLYSHECYNEINDEMVGMVACPYHKPNLIKKFSKSRTQKVSGLALSPTINTIFTYLPIFRKNLQVIWFPENCTAHSHDYDLHLNLLYGHIWAEAHLVYFKQAPTLTVPGSIKELREFELKSFHDVDRMVISEGVEILHRKALKGCGSISCLELPRSLQEFCIVGRIFQNLQKIILPLDRLDFYLSKLSPKHIGGIREFPDRQQAEIEICVGGNHSASTYRGNTSLEEVKINKENRLKRSAFEGCINLRSAKLPHSLVQLPGRIFKNCVKLVDVMMPVDLTVIGEEAFSGCSSMYRVFLPETVVQICDRAFQDCTALRKIFLPNGIQRIEKQAFAGCVNLREVLLPPSIRYIAPDAFDGCDALTSVKVPPDMTIRLPFGPQVQRIVYHPKGETQKTEANTINLLTELEVNCDEELDNGKYAQQQQLQTVSFRLNVTSIPKHCFQNCTGLETVELSETVTTLRKGAFAGCSALADVHGLHTIQTVGSHAFADCQSLRQVKFYGFKLKHIGSSAFENCVSLTCLKIPKSVRTIGYHAFSGCTGLKYVEISANFKEQIDYIFGQIDHSIIHYVY